MNRLIEWSRNGLALAGVLALGYALGNGTGTAKTVHAASGDTQFQLSGVSEGSSLLVYQPDSKTVYVYRAATTGNATVQCSYKFIVNQPGGSIQRVNCPVGSAN